MLWGLEIPPCNFGTTQPRCSSENRKSLWMGPHFAPCCHTACWEKKKRSRKAQKSDAETLLCREQIPDVVLAHFISLSLSQALLSAGLTGFVAGDGMSFPKHRLAQRRRPEASLHTQPCRTHGHLEQRSAISSLLSLSVVSEHFFNHINASKYSSH